MATVGGSAGACRILVKPHESVPLFADAYPVRHTVVYPGGLRVV